MDNSESSRRLIVLAGSQFDMSERRMIDIKLIGERRAAIVVAQSEKHSLEKAQ